MQVSQPSSSPITSPGKSRGKLILALGISSLVFIPGYLMVNNIPSRLVPHWSLGAELFVIVIMLAIFIPPILGISAWLMANTDLRKIRDGIIPVSAHGITNTGWLLSVFGTFVNPVFFCAVLLDLFSSVSIPTNKDAMINDLNNLCSHAYQFRIRPASMGGGEGSYRGYAIPTKMSQNENGRYTAYILHPDTVKFIGKAIHDSSNTIEVKIDSEARLIASSWIYAGDFK